MRALLFVVVTAASSALFAQQGGQSIEPPPGSRLVLEAVRQKKTTEDIGGKLGTREAGEFICQTLSS